METLKAIRNEREKNLTPLVVLDNRKTTGNVLVVLERPAKRSGPSGYNCHRYFTIGGNWAVSVDGWNVGLDAVWSWLNKPTALSNDPVDEAELVE